jgi:thiamine-phosphate pyrophosphorylase
MASELARAKLARAARVLNAGCRLPYLILMTDEIRLPDPLNAARALPKGGAIIVRHRQAKARSLLAERLKPIAKQRSLILLIGEDADLAVSSGADGLHLPETRLNEAAHWKAIRPFWLITAAAHSGHALMLAARSCADAVLLAPAFPTRSHADRSSLGILRFRFMAQDAAVPVYALGGVDAQTILRLAGSSAVGIAAISGLLPDQKSAL